MKKNIPLIISSLVVAFGAGIFVAHAQSYVPLAPLPIGEGGATPEAYTLTTYLSGAIKLLIAIGGALSILMAIIGGAQYVTAGIAPSAKQDAKNRILNAFTGLALILSSYLILNSINPKLVKFDLSLENVTPKVTIEPSGAPPINYCGIIYDSVIPSSWAGAPEAREMESGSKVIFYTTKRTPDEVVIDNNLKKLQAEVLKLKDELLRYNPPATIMVTSAYRPYAYQKHLYQVFTGYNALSGNSSPECSVIKRLINDEYTKHFGSGTSTVANPDDQNAPHMKGIGVDIKITGMSNALANAIAFQKDIKLKWQEIPGDEVHWNLQQ